MVGLLNTSCSAARICSTIEIGVIVVAVVAALPPLQLEKLKANPAGGLRAC